ncbi:MAG TPA: class I SAM-dependent methyltransferase [Xanthobacteraceae bacterium]|nr:class I SAM-dependent methyltransferase [Xanthobacteraceae bacterium]
MADTRFAVLLETTLADPLDSMTHLASRIIDHYERHAAEWDRDRQSGPWNDKLWHVRFAERLAPGARILDLGCGSGRPVAQYMAGRGLHVTGVDSSATMISLCRSRLPGHEWIVADMRTLSLGRRFDGVLAWDSFFHLAPDDQRRMFDVFAAHASTEALLMFNAGPAHGEAIGAYRGDPLYHASLDPAEYQTLITQIGFEIVAHVVEDAHAGGRTAWLCRRR